MGDLVVELYGTTVGRLRGVGPALDFEAEPGAIERFGLDSLVLSVSVPLAIVPARARKARRQNFFRELMPEGRLLTRLASEAGVAEHDVAGLLRSYGRDVAGALQIWDPQVPGEPREPAVEATTESDVADLLHHAARFPLANKPGGGKTSLNGVQDKIVLARLGDGWARALDGHPSTHILKPEPRDTPTLIYDEEYGSRFVRALGLAEHRTWIDDFAGVPALVVERYDREPGSPGAAPRRVHQEDFNQVLGARGDQKYQRLGGKVSLARIARELTVLGDRDGLRRLARLTVLSVAVGNLDMHAKNLALVHRRDGGVHLAPGYDVVPMAHLPTDGELALAVGGQYRHAAVTGRDLIEELTTWGLRDAATIVQETLATVRDVATREEPHPSAHRGVADEVLRFATNLLQGAAAGG